MANESSTGDEALPPPMAHPEPPPLPRPADEALDSLTEALAQRLGVPIALLSLSSDDALRPASSHGLALEGVLPAGSPCERVAARGEPLVVPDTLADERFAASPLVVGEPHMRFYAGVPLTSSSGHVLGTLCAIDRRPRDLSDDDRRFLGALARLAAHTVELRAAAATYREEVRRSAEDLHAALVHIDEEGRISWASSDARRLLELPAAPAGPVRLASLFADTSGVHEALVTSVRSGNAVQGLEVHTRGSGPELHLRLDVEPRRIPGQPSYARCQLTDLAQPEDPAAVLRRYELLFDVGAPVCTADSRGHFDLVNPAWERMLGWSKHELRSHPFLWFVHPDDLAKTEAVTRSLYETGSLARFENRYRCRDGSYRTLSWTASVADGVIVATARDVSTEAAALARLHFSNDLYVLIETLQREFIESGEGASWWQTALSGLISLTGSEYGFIGTVERDEQGKYLQTKAITDISWDESTRDLYERNRSTGMQFRNLDTLFGRVVSSGTTVVANDVAHDPRASGRPHGHPPLERFLGISCGRGEHIVGVIGLANRQGGYSAELVAELEPAAAFVESTINSLRNASRRRLAESRLDAIVEASVDAIVTIDERGIVQSVNPAVGRLFGYEPAECVGQNVSMLMHSPDRDKHDSYLARYVQTGEKRIIGRGREVVGRRKDGSEIWLDLSVTEVNLEGSRTFTGILKDITARVLDDRRLRATAAQLASALEMANAARWEYDVEADRFTFNDAFYKLFGSTVESAGSYYLPSSEYIARFVHPDDAALVATELSRSVTTPDAVYTREFEHRFLYADGRVGYLFVRVFATREHEHGTRKHYGVAQDVTVHRREEQVRARMEEQERLNRALAERVEELDQSRRVSSLTSECVELVQRCVSIDESLELTTRFLAQMYPEANIEVYEQVEATQELTLRTRERRFGSFEPKETLESNDCWAVRTRRVYAMLPGGSRIRCPHFPRGVHHPGQSAPPDGSSASVCAPLLSMDRMVGLVSLTLPPPAEGATTSYAERIARSMAQFENTMQSLGGALSTVSLRESLQRLALVDELTSLPNRRAFVAAAHKSLARARRAKESVVVAIFDVDHFKQVNDTWGHDGGDRVLRAIAEVALGFFRSEDVLGRLGGEEFGVLMVMSSATEALRRLDSFRQEIRQRCRAGQSPVTVSIGFSISDPAVATTLDELMREADTALYQAKRSGRDRVVQGEAPNPAVSIRPQAT